MPVKKELGCDKAISTFTKIDLFSKPIELTYEGSVYNKTIVGAGTTVILIVGMMFVGLQDFAKVTGKHINLVN